MPIVVVCKNCRKDFTPRYRAPGSRDKPQEWCSMPCVIAWKGSPAGTAERFWAKVDKSAGVAGCWLWLAKKDKDGYGSFSVGPKGANFPVRAHRFAYEMVNPPLGSMNGCHTCDTPACVNPAHIFPGTAKDNVRDMIAKGRKPTGAQVKVGRKFTDDDIRAIRKARGDGESNAAIAERFKMIPNHIGRIVSRRRYAWVA